MSNNPSRAAGSVILRNFFYKDGFRILLMALVLLSLGFVILSAMLYAAISHKPEPKYFAATYDGKLIRMEPMSSPMVSSSALLDWTTKAVARANTYNFAQWREQLSEASFDFTPAGWQAFTEALKISGNLDAVRNRRLIATARVNGPAVIVNEYKNTATGRYTWNVQFPLSVVYEGSGESRNEQALIAKVTVVRVPTTESEKGIAIDQVVLPTRK